MLEELRLHNFGAISGELFLSPGFNVIIGETGTGKSLLLSSINFLLGHRLSFTSDGTFVEAVFRLNGEEVCVRREVSGGRSRYFLNGMRVPQQRVKNLISPFFIFQSQRQGITLLKPSVQLQLLDTFSENEELLSEYRKVYTEYTEALSSLEKLREEEKLRDREIDILKFQIEEIERVNLQPGEEEELRKLKEKVERADQIRELRSKALCLLYECEGSVLDVLSQVIKEFERSSLYPEILDRLNSLYFDLESVVSEIEREVEPPETELSLEEIEDRLYQIERLKRKYGSDYDEISSFLKDAKEKLERLENLTFELEQAEKRVKELEEQLYSLGRGLSQRRREGAEKLKNYLKDSFSELGLESARFEILFEELEKPSPSGLERVTFLFSGNPKLPLSPLSESISGGELSRFLLSVLSFISFPEITMVFDEIDTGMSGKILRKVAKKLKVISEKQQVLAVSHSPQVVAAADRVFKLERDFKGNVDIRVLEREELEKELSVMLSGEVTESGIKTAQDLLKSWEE